MKFNCLHGTNINHKVNHIVNTKFREKIDIVRDKVSFFYPSLFSLKSPVTPINQFWKYPFCSYMNPTLTWCRNFFKKSPSLIDEGSESKEE